MTFGAHCLQEKTKLRSQNNKSARTVHCQFKKKMGRRVTILAWQFWAMQKIYGGRETMASSFPKLALRILLKGIMTVL